MRRINGLDYLAIILLIIGGLNWGSIGLFNLDFVAAVFGEFTTLSRVIYIVVGVAALYALFTSGKLTSTNRSERDRDREYRTV